MKKVRALLLLMMFLVSVGGCAGKERELNTTVTEETVLNTAVTEETETTVMDTDNSIENDVKGAGMDTTSEIITKEKMGRKLVWNDEFDGEKLDMAKWRFHRTMGNSGSEYSNAKKYVDVQNDKLTMNVYKSGVKGKDYALSEGVTTQKTMYYKYGYVEICANPPFRHGAWPSFWLQTKTPYAKADYMAEIDVFEIFSDEKTVVNNLHKWKFEGKQKHTMLQGRSCSYVFKDYKNLNREYHLYGFEWNKEYMAFYVDDVEYSRHYITEEHDFDKVEMPGMEGFHDFAYLIFNNEIFTKTSGWKPENSVLNDSDPMPITYNIEWVRLYQKGGEELIIP